MRKIILILGFLYFSLHDVFAQCAMCDVVAEAKPEDSESSINAGMIYIMVMPCVIVFLVILLVFFIIKRLKK